MQIVAHLQTNQTMQKRGIAKCFTSLVAHGAGAYLRFL